MKKLGAALIAAATLLLSGCIAVPVDHYDQGYYRGGHGQGHYRGDRGYGYRADRDGDGVPNRYDRRPSNPRWY